MRLIDLFMSDISIILSSGLTEEKYKKINGYNDLYIWS